jgi:hypothetical protein
VSADAIVILNACVVVCAVGAVLSVTFTVKLKVPAAFGVPAITPVAAVKDNPPGKAPLLIDHV